MSGDFYKGLSTWTPSKPKGLSARARRTSEIRCFLSPVDDGQLLADGFTIKAGVPGCWLLSAPKHPRRFRDIRQCYNYQG